jgi:acyl-CoA thioesterase-1
MKIVNHLNMDSMCRLIVALLALVSISCHAGEKTTILVVGDSLSSGYGLQTGEAWVDLLAQDLIRQDMDIEIVNDSISGDTTAGGAVRLPAALQRIRPDWVIIELGGNDGLRGSSLVAMQQNLLKMVRFALDQGASPILLGMKLPPNYGKKYTEGFEQVYQRVAEKTGVPLLPLFIEGIEGNLDLFQPDGIHPNAEAQPIIKENVREFLGDLL